MKYISIIYYLQKTNNNTQKTHTKKAVLNNIMCAVTNVPSYF